ncbi:MAG: chorismate-binding protein [Bdellovibrionota bacterium]
MSLRPDIIAAARGSGPFLAFAESGKSAIFAWGEGEHGKISCQTQKFYFPRDRGGELWDGFSLAARISPAHSETIDRLPLISPVRALPDQEEAENIDWLNFCQKIDVEIFEGRLRKVVPSRMRTFPLHPSERTTLLDAIFANLFAPSKSNTFRFLLREKEDLFFGATPELLFRREKGTIFVPAIAGTRSLAHGTEAESAADLMNSAKDREEHSLVVEGIIESLRGLGLKPQAPASPDILRVPGLLHLFTPISAPDPGSISSEKLVLALHPTPAVGGLPKAGARDFLFSNEPWDRGLFASPLLFNFPGREFCLVAIRSGLLTATDLHLFAGAGYVKNSKAENEWVETDRKMDVLQSMLTGKNL